MGEQSRFAVVTGSTGGIGQEVCKTLASQGWDLVLVNRSREKSEAQERVLREASPQRQHRSHIVDLLNPEEVADGSRMIASETPAIGALYNIAGLLTDRPTVSPQGLEGHFVVNTLAPYLMTQGLRSSLTGGASTDRPSIVVNFSSSAIKGVKKLDFDQLIEPGNAGGLLGAYAQSKAALTAATAMMSGELADENVLALSVDPGATRTPMTSGGDGMPWFVRLLVPLLFKSPEAQAKKLLKGISSAVAEKAPGAFIVEGQLRPLPAIASDQALQAELKTRLEDVANPYLALDA